MALLSICLPLFFVMFSFGELLRIQIFKAVSMGPLDLILFFIFSNVGKIKEFFFRKKTLHCYIVTLLYCFSQRLIRLWRKITNDNFVTIRNVLTASSDSARCRERG